MNKHSITFEAFLCELKKKLPYPDIMSETEMDIVLADFHDGLDVDSVAYRLIYGN